MLKRNTREVQEAYETLSDEQNGQPMTNMVLRVPMEDSVVELAVSVALMVLALVALKIFSPSFFGGGGASRNPNAPRQGDDLQYRVNLKFEEAILVQTKKLNTIVRRPVILVMALVRKPGTNPVTCGRCHGAGVINVDTQTPLE